MLKKPVVKDSFDLLSDRQYGFRKERSTGDTFFYPLCNQFGLLFCLLWLHGRFGHFHRFIFDFG